MEAVMARRLLSDLLDHLRRAARPAAGLADGDLLGRFADGRDGAAFEALVWRHGPLVYGVCRRALCHAQDAEDAFQATFLVLARKAATVRRRGAVGPWLYRVAHRVALRARSRATSAAPSEPLPDTLPAPAIPDPVERAELRRLVEEEIARLPGRCRAAAELRYLDGRTTAEAAAALGCPPGTVLSRLAAARRRLRARLTARGADLPAALAVAAGATGSVPAAWVATAVAAAAGFPAGSRPGRAAVLAADILRDMLMTKVRVGAVVVLGAVAAGVGLLLPGPTAGQPDGPPAAVPPAEVIVTRPVKRSAADHQDFAGRALAAATVQIRSRVTAYVQKVAVRPGARVKRGDLLFELDPRTFQADTDKAKAEVMRAETQMRSAEVAATRVKHLHDTRAVTSEEVERAQAAVDETRAALMVAKAGLDRAALDLSATRVAAPIDGQVGATVLDAGNLAGPATVLATIVTTDPIPVAFDIDERSYRRYRTTPHGPTVQVGLSGEDGFPRAGKVEFVDNEVDPASGTVRVRAAVANPAGDILPGMSARVRLTVDQPRDEWLLPAAAVRSDGVRPYVLVVGAGNAVEWRAVTVGKEEGGRRAVTAGVGAADRVIVSGLGSVTPGAPLRVGDADPAP
jgi:membrane fusion protein, multidrug efflux system